MNRFAWLTLLTAAGSAAAGPGGKPAATVEWTRAEVAGYELKLMDDQRICDLVFDEKGYVAATLGKKCGLVVAPVLNWRIDADGVLVISELGDDGRVWFRFKKVKVGNGRAEVERDGKRETFSRAKR